MMKQFGGLLLAFAILVISGLQPAMAGWRAYENPRFGFSFTYPAHVFTPEPEPENGDGNRFFATDAEAIISVWGSYNTLDQNPKSYFEWARNEVGVVDNITYKRIAKDWLIISGYKSGMVYYEKTIFSCNFQRTTSVSITYPASRKKDYDGMVGRLTKSLDPGKPDGCE